MENKEAMQMAGREREKYSHATRRSLPLSISVSLSFSLTPPLAQFSLLDAVSLPLSALRDWLSSGAQAIRLLEGGT